MKYEISRSSAYGDRPHANAVEEPLFRWTIEIPDLLEFARQEGRLVLTVGNDIPKIEIYDDWRE